MRRRFSGPARSVARSNASAAGSFIPGTPPRSSASPRYRLEFRHWSEGPRRWARAPYEFGIKVSLTTTNKRAKGGQFILHAKALPGNPYDSHTLKEVPEETEALTGREIERVYVDKGYRGHNAPKPLRVFHAGQKHGVHGQIKKELRRRSAIEPVIGHCKSDGHLDRNCLHGRLGDQINAVMSAVGYNFRLLLRWLKLFLRQIIAAISAKLISMPA